MVYTYRRGPVIKRWSRGRTKRNVSSHRACLHTSDRVEAAQQSRGQPGKEGEETTVHHVDEDRQHQAGHEDTQLVPHSGGRRQEAICEFQASLVYTRSSRTAKTTQRDPISMNK